MVKKKDLCILHIGMPKTGSSTIQDNLFQGVKDKRVSFTDLGVANHSGPLYGLFLSSDKLPHYHYFKAHNIKMEDVECFRCKIKERLEKQFLDFNTTINILSGEDLYHSSYDEIKKMKSYLEKFFNKIIIIAYVRPITSFYSSAFQQRVNDQELNSMNHALIYHRYRNLEQYDILYGEKNVKILPFVPNKFINNDILSDFCYHAGIEQQISNIKVSNLSLSKEVVSILFTFNFYKEFKTSFGNKDIAIRNKLISILKNIGNEKFQFSGKLIQSIVEEHYQDDYNWLLNRIPSQYKEDFYIDPNVIGINSESELIEYATNFINELVELINDDSISFPLEKKPQTVAKLVNVLRIQIAKEMGL